MYADTLKRIDMQPKEQAELAKQILIWILYGAELLTVEVLQHALAIHPDTQDFDAARIVPEETLIAICCGLVAIEIDYSYRPTFRLIRE